MKMYKTLERLFFLVKKSGNIDCICLNIVAAITVDFYHKVIPSRVLDHQH